MILFSDYFMEKRGSDSQETISTRMSIFNELFKDISAVTISRWENDKSFPHINTLIQVVLFFNDMPHIILPQIKYPSKGGFGRSLPQYLSNKITFLPKGVQVSNFPVSKNYLITNLSTNFDTNLTKALLDFDHSIFDTPDPVTNDILRFWSQRGSNICLVSTLNSQFCGHLIALRVSQEVFDLLIKGEVEESQIPDDEIRTKEEPHCLYIYSIYGANKIIASTFIIELLRQILLSQGMCLTVGGLCATPDGLMLAKKMGLRAATIGPSTPSSQVKIEGRIVDWITYSGSISDIFRSIGINLVAEVQLNISP